MDTPRQIAEQWLQAFNDKNLDALLDLYHEDAQHLSPKLRTQRPETRGLIVGKAALRDWWADAFRRLPTLHYRLQTLVADGQGAFIRYARVVAGEADLEVAEFYQVEAGKIVLSHVYHG